MIPPVSVLLSASQLSKSHGARLLFEDLTFAVESGQKIGLIGPNGAGKSTLLRLLARRDSPDAGSLSFTNGLRLGFLEQDPVFAQEEIVEACLLDATGDPHDPAHIARVSELISRLGLDGAAAGRERPIRELSGGWRKRVALARELARDPDLLLLDEPTNHLDVEGIEWIEDFLASRERLALITVTHDRLFLQNTCDFIFDLDRRNPDGLIQFDGSYADFVAFKEGVLDAQRTLEATRKNTLRRETAWLRRGAKARQTKQKARIERAGALADEVSVLEDKNRLRRVEIDFGDSGRTPKKIIEAKGIGQKRGDRWLFRNFDFILGARSRVGLLGANGCGKTTLIRTLLEELTPDEGSVRRADGIEFAVFEQGKDSLTPGVSVLRSLLPQGDYVQVRGQNVFARSYLSRFHFQSNQMDMPVEKLSGGEKTRLLLAKLMLRSEPVLVLDEPTNDLDLETLETLEQALADFPGAVILVTHDRFFLDQVANEILAFDGDGGVERFADLFQWEEWRRKQAARPRENPAAAPSSGAPAAAPAKAGGKKLGYKEQREFDAMETTLQAAEEKAARLHEELAQPGVQSDYAALQRLTAELQAAQAEIDRLYARWQELTDKQA